MSRTQMTVRLIAGIVFTLTMLQWILRLRLAIEGFLRSGIEGVKAEVMDSAIHLTGNWSLGWRTALLIQVALLFLTVISGVLCFRGRSSTGGPKFGPGGSN